MALRLKVLGKVWFQKIYNGPVVARISNGFIYDIYLGYIYIELRVICYHNANYRL